MKKFDKKYFDKKYTTLFERLISKTEFKNEIDSIRNKEGIPQDGFSSTRDLAVFLGSKFNSEETDITASCFFFQEYETKIGRECKETDMEDAQKEFSKLFEESPHVDYDQIDYLVDKIDSVVSDHHIIFTRSYIFEMIPKIKKIFLQAQNLLPKYHGVDLLDPYITIHMIEKYLFLGEDGVQSFITNQTICKNCRYLGINYFSPQRKDMEGQEEGAFKEGYVFNEETNKMLSRFFDCGFIIVKQYATKGEVLQYIDDNWESLKEELITKNVFYKQFGLSISKIKPSDLEKNRLVYELSKLTKKELIQRYNGDRDFAVPGIYKETIISSILKEEYGIQMNGEAVKKTAVRFSKSEELIKNPKDIEDI